jgi:4-azaleucine resistance transporter AzlC
MAKTRTINPTRRGEFWAGIKDTFPLVVGAIPFGIIFGATASANNLSAGGAVAMSLFVFAGSAQFIASTLIFQQTSPFIIIVTTFVVNLRHALYSASLAPHTKKLSQRWLIPLAFWLTDESFVVAISRYDEPDASPYKHWYLFGSEIFMYVNWNLCTVIGIIAGQRIPNPRSWGLDFALVVTFIGIVVPSVKNRPILMAAIVSGITAALTNSLPNKLGLFIAAILGVIVGLISETIWTNEKPTVAAAEIEP